MTTRTKGTGLGLAIVQRITEQHGGTLHLADAPKRNGKMRGAAVRIDLPIWDTQEARNEGDADETASDTAVAEGEREEEGVIHGV
jgi:two-component system nitrogen regulation sensor histidine kinase NtrY